MEIKTPAFITSKIETKPEGGFNLTFVDNNEKNKPFYPFWTAFESGMFNKGVQIIFITTDKDKSKEFIDCILAIVLEKHLLDYPGEKPPTVDLCVKEVKEALSKEDIQNLVDGLNIKNGDAVAVFVDEGTVSERTSKVMTDKFYEKYYHTHKGVNIAGYSLDWEVGYSEVEFNKRGGESK